MTSKDGLSVDHHPKRYWHCDSAVRSTATTRMSNTAFVVFGRPDLLAMESTSRPQNRHTTAEGWMDSAQNGQGRRRGGSMNSSKPAKGVKATERRNHPIAERPNSRDASKATARARRPYRPIPISIVFVSARKTSADAGDYGVMTGNID